MELIESLKTALIETAQTLSGATRRLFMARIVKMLGPGGAQRAEKELSWNRGTIRKGQHESESGFINIDNFSGVVGNGLKNTGPNWSKTFGRLWVPKAR